MYPNVEQQFGQAHTMNSSGQVRREIALTLRQRKPGRGREANLIVRRRLIVVERPISWNPLQGSNRRLLDRAEASRSTPLPWSSISLVDRSRLLSPRV